VNCFVAHVVVLAPLIVTGSVCLQVYRARGTRLLNPFGLALLVIITAFAAMAAGSFLYFDFKPAHLPPWESPEVLLLGLFVLVGPLCMITSFLTFGKQPKWLFWVLEFASAWLTAVGLLAASAY
jgi:hypothetical protein